MAAPGCSPLPPPLPPRARRPPRHPLGDPLFEAHRPGLVEPLALQTSSAGTPGKGRRSGRRARTGIPRRSRCPSSGRSTALRRCSGTGAAGVRRAASCAAPAGGVDPVRLRARWRGRPSPRRAASSPSGAPSKCERVRAATRDRQRLRIGQPDVLRPPSRSSAAPGTSGSSPALDHPRHPVERALRVAAAQRLVVARRSGCSAPRRTCRRPGRRRGEDVRRARPGVDLAAEAHLLRRRLEHGQRAPRVAVGRRRQEAMASSVTRSSMRAEAALPVGERPPQERGEVRRPRAARARTTRDRESSAALSSKLGFSVVAPMSVISPVLDGGQEGVLLRPLNRWISSQKRIVSAPQPAALLRLAEDLPHALHALGDGAEGARTRGRCAARSGGPAWSCRSRAAPRG